ncbi:O-antigen ligase family protein [Candidatus Omnitrophota bacterium]
MKPTSALRYLAYISCCVFAVSIPFNFSLKNLSLNTPLIKNSLMLEAALTIVLWEFVVLLERRFEIREKFLILPVFAFFLIHIFSSVIPSERMVWSLKYTFRFFSLGLIAFAVMNFVDTEKRLKVLMRSLFAGGVLASFFVIIHYFRNDALIGLQRFFDDAAVNPRRIRGLFGWPTNMSVYFGTLLPLAVSHLMYKTGMRIGEKIAYFIIALLFLLCMILSGARGWVGGAFCALGVFGAIHLIKKENYRAIWISVAAILIIMLLFASGLFGLRDLAFSKLEPTETARIGYFGSALRYIKQYPFRGIGADMLYWKTNPQFRSHNILLEIQATLGFFGFLTLLWLFGALFWYLFKGIFRYPGINRSYVQIGVLASLASYLGHNQVDCFWQLHEIAGLFWVMVGIGMASNYCETN